MSVGRNDPCPCGSGKKYKKCCLAKDEEAARERAAPRPIPIAPPGLAAPKREEPPKPLPDPFIEALNARYKEFETADYEKRVALFQQTLDERELMDDEMAFEMLNELFVQAAERNDRDQYDSLVESLREQLPEVYGEEAHFLLENRILNALVMKRPELVDLLTRELAVLAGDHIDTWNDVEKRLAYHGYLTTLVEAMRLAWPEVRVSEEIVPWGIEEFSERASHYEMLNYIAETLEPGGDNPVLVERLKFYFGDNLDRDRMAEMVALYAGQAQRHWTMDDFDYQPPRQRSLRDWEEEEEVGTDKPDPGRRNLFDLALQFVNYAHRIEGVPYSKAELARGEIYDFITRRHAGDLEYHESMLDSALRSAGKKREPIKKYKQFGHLLCPDPERLDHFLAQKLQLLSFQPHNTAAMMELVPAWMRFLQTQALFDAELRRETLNDLKEVARSLLRVLNDVHGDPSLPEAIRRWPEEAEKEPQ